VFGFKGNPDKRSAWLGSNQSITHWFNRWLADLAQNTRSGRDTICSGRSRD